MHPLIRGAAASAVLFALSSLDPPRAPAPPAIVPPAGAARALTPGAPVAGVAALCPPHTLPEGDACIPLPAPAPAASLEPRGDQHLPRRPDRPAEADAYRYPVGPPDGSPALIGGFELSPEGEPRPGVVDLVATKGERVALTSLEEQEGEAEVAFVGKLSGITVGTLHRVREGDRLHRYLVLHGHLERPGPGVVQGARLRAGDVVGFAGDSGTPGQVHLRLEVRKIREGTVLERLEPKRLLDPAFTVPSDPRNLLPLRAAPAQGAP